MARPLRSYFPILESLKGYDRTSFITDMAAGFIVGIILIPQGMAYAFLAGMPPVYGLYAGLVPLFMYGLFGSSRQMSIGPVAISSILILAGVSQLAEPFSEDYISLVITTGFAIGITQFLLGMFRAGRMAHFISRPVISGFTSAAAIIIAINQLKDVLGITIPNYEYSYETLLYAIENITSYNLTSLIMSISAIVVMLAFKKWLRRIPGALVVTVLSIIITWSLSLDAKGLEIIGTIPKGLPSVSMPVLTYDIFRTLAPVVITLTVIGIVESTSIAKVMESKHGNYHINLNQELIALGLSKLAGSFFQSLPTSGSFSRSAVNSEGGADTQISSLFTVLLVILTLIFLTPLFYYLPKAILAAIILISVRKLVDFEDAKFLWKTHRIDFGLMTITFVATLIFGIEEGVFAGIFLSILNVLYRSSKPNLVILGNIPGTTYYRNIKRFKEAEQIEGKLIVRFENQIYFGNASYFKESIRNIVKAHKREVKEVLLDAKSIHYVDSSGIKALQELNKYLVERQISFTICGAIGTLRDQLGKSGFLAEIGEEKHFIYLHHAIENGNPQKKEEA